MSGIIGNVDVPVLEKRVESLESALERDRAILKAIARFFNLNIKLEKRIVISSESDTSSDIDEATDSTPGYWDQTAQEYFDIRVDQVKK